MALLYLIKRLFIFEVLLLYLITPYCRYYSLVLVVLFYNYNILLGTIYLDTFKLNICLMQNLIYLF